MARYFFDTSAFVKFYHAEVGTGKVSAMFSEQGREIRISSIGLLEVQSAFAVKVGQPCSESHTLFPLAWAASAE